MIGQALGHYRILDKIGSGGMGEVYRAHDELLKRSVAIKILSLQSSIGAETRNRLLREARAASALNDPHICTIYEVGEAAGQAFIVMELVEGHPLTALVPPEGLTAKLALRYGTQIAAALAHAHERGVIHRDIKSSNIVVTPAGQVKVLDFGLARRVSGVEEETVSLASEMPNSSMVGTLPYMAPEVLRSKEADARSDIWALGVVLYEMTAGRRPFRGLTAHELTSAILYETPAAVPTGVPAGLQHVIERCLEKEPGQRYQRAGEVLAALEATRSDAPFAVGSSAQQGTVPKRRVSWALVSLAAALVLLAVLVALNLSGWRDHLLGRVSSPRIESLAVLPLENLSGDPQQEYFADGMTETLIAELSKISALKVISRTSVMHYKGGARKPLPQIARELGVDGVVEGTVTREGEQVRISVQLIHGVTDKHLWAENYQRELRGILALQSEVAREIATRIRAKVTPQELAQLTSTRSVNPEAYQLYLQGRYFMLSFGKEDFIRKGARYLEDSVAKDPNYAPAYSALAFTYAELAMFGYDPPQVGFAKARTTVMKALELDENLGEAHAVLGHIKYLFDWDWSGAEKEERRALELSPNSADTHDEYGFYLTLMGRSDESIAQLQKALELDPVPVQRTVNVGWCNLMAGRYDDAIIHLKKAVELNPDYPAAHMELAWAFARKGMRAEANTEYEKTRRFVPAGKDQLLDAWLAPTYVLHDKRNEGLKLAEWWGRESRRRHVDSYLVAAMYAQLGVKERALDWLERGYEQHSPIMLGLKAEPFVDSLRSDPRFQDLLRRMDFPQ